MEWQSTRDLEEETPGGLGTARGERLDGETAENPPRWIGIKGENSMSEGEEGQTEYVGDGSREAGNAGQGWAHLEQDWGKGQKSGKQERKQMDENWKFLFYSVCISSS